MKIGNVNLSPDIRELPVLLNIKRNAKYSIPIPENNGYILNPAKFKDLIEKEPINFNEIKFLLLMMLKGDTDLIKNLIKTDNSRFVNVQA